MERMVVVFAANPAAAGAGLIGIVCLASWPLFRARRAMLTTYIGSNLAFVVHYALLGHWTAVAMNGVMALQTLAAMYLVERPRLRWVYYLLMPALAGGSLITSHGLPSLLAGVAATISAVGRVQINQIYLRAWLLTSAVTWLAHDVVVGSLPGLTAHILSMTTGAVMLLLRSSGPSGRENQPRRLAVQN